jgi:WhiB family redox-sensing transcriptional regulator
VFFSGSRADERSALALCSTCTVRADCLDHALEVRERFGVWGGTTEQDRRRILRMGA